MEVFRRTAVWHRLGSIRVGLKTLQMSVWIKKNGFPPIRELQRVKKSHSI
jgi:hypothetical protein